MPAVSVGSDHVIESGTFILSDWISSAKVMLDDLAFEFKFLPSTSPPQAMFGDIQTKSLEVRLMGHFGNMGCYWRFQNIALMNSRQVDLLLIVWQLAGPAGSPPVFKIDYTFASTSYALPSPVPVA